VVLALDEPVLDEGVASDDELELAFEVPPLV